MNRKILGLLVCVFFLFRVNCSCSASRSTERTGAHHFYQGLSEGVSCSEVV